ncbi:hypothetical protein FRB96_008873 [Tulasnella sp. 330]|nr:hypothetical protein FRB96_008873 [Tulasnella sp. 330]KAG8881829.1 hypothetical protein FRB97_009094 [Tulasnella sp. 331]
MLFQKLVSVASLLAAPVLVAGSGANSEWLHTLQKRTLFQTCSVKALGGGKDDAPNILAAFEKCKEDAIIVLDGSYTVGTLLKATLKNVEISLTGTIQYTNNITYWSPNSLFLTYQNATTFFFLSGTNIYLHGGGTIDGNGQLWWNTYEANKNAGVAGGSSTTFARPIPLTIGNATNVVVDNIAIKQSPFWHNFLYQSTNVVYSRLSLSSVSNNASSPSANSDGIDIYRSSNVLLTGWTVNNDDDCVSFKPNTTDIIVSDMNCNGSHGISVGSLGQYKGETDIVSNIYVNNITMANAQNGARIKVFPDNPNAGSVIGGGTGFVKNITFANFFVQNVDNPILIDQ